MPFKIALRTNSGRSYFQRYLRELVELPVKKAKTSGLVLCNAYWRDALLAERIDSRGTLVDEIDLHCAGGFLGTVASSKYESTSKDWQYYKDFVTRLRAELKTVTVFPQRGRPDLRG